MLIVVAAVLAVVIPLVVVGMSPAFASDPADAGSTQAPHSIIPR